MSPGLGGEALPGAGWAWLVSDYLTHPDCAVLGSARGRRMGRRQGTEISTRLVMRQ